MLDCNGPRARRSEVIESSSTDDTSCMVWSVCKVGMERENQEILGALGKQISVT